MSSGRVKEQEVAMGVPLLDFSTKYLSSYVYWSANRGGSWDGYSEFKTNDSCMCPRFIRIRINTPYYEYIKHLSEFAHLNTFVRSFVRSNQHSVLSHCSSPPLGYNNRVDLVEFRHTWNCFMIRLRILLSMKM